MLSRREEVLAGLDIRNLHGIEIGPLDSPIVDRADGRVDYVDHAATSDLRIKYKDDPKVNLSRLVDVDFVWGERTLAEIAGTQQFDYAVASHVIEHVPNFIGWLNEIDSILKVGGELRLVIPDRRFSFDYRRRESRLCDILSALLAKSRAPLPIQIIDHFAEMVDLDPAQAWRYYPQQPPFLDKSNDSGGFELARRVSVEGGYHDVHCWVFTPHSLAEIMLRTARLGLHRFGCSFLEVTKPGQLEFYCAMRVDEDRESVIETWLTMLDRVQNIPTRDIDNNQPSNLPIDIPEAETLRRERDLAIGRLNEIESSRAWHAVVAFRRLKLAYKDLLAILNGK